MQIEIWSDIACPWCYIGKRRFEKALAQYEHADRVEVVWRSYQLDPNAPRDQTALTIERLMAKYDRSREQALRMMERVSEVAAGEGLAYRLDIARSSNTLDAHRLVHAGFRQGLIAALNERFMRAYQMEGAYLADPEVLTRLAVEVGLEREEVEAVLGSDAYADEVRADQQRADLLGVDGVPFFGFDATTGISGAQSTEVFLRALRELGPKTVPLERFAGADGMVCDDDGCAVPKA